MPAIEAKGSVNIGGVRTHCPNITLLLSGHLGVQAEGALVREYNLGSFSWSRETPRMSTEQLMVSLPRWRDVPAVLRKQLWCRSSRRISDYWKVV